MRIATRCASQPQAGASKYNRHQATGARSCQKPKRGGGEAECELRAVLRQPACLRDRLKLGHLLTLAAVDSAPCSPLTASRLSAGSSRSSWEVRGGGWAVASAAPRIA